MPFNPNQLTKLPWVVEKGWPLLWTGSTVLLSNWN